MYIAKVLILLGLIKMMDQDVKPIWSSGIYTTIIVLLNLFSVMEIDLLAIFLNGVVVFLLSFAYFWAVDKLRGRGLIRGIVVVLGILFGFI